MTGDIIHLGDHRGPRKSGPVVCTRCRAHWIAIRSVDVTVMECLNCGAMSAGDIDWLMSREQEPEECCGQKDSDGVCAAPACIWGEMSKRLEAIRIAYRLEHEGPYE